MYSRGHNETASFPPPRPTRTVQSSAAAEPSVLHMTTALSRNMATASSVRKRAPRGGGPPSGPGGPGEGPREPQAGAPLPGTYGLLHLLLAVVVAVGCTASVAWHQAGPVLHAMTDQGLQVQRHQPAAKRAPARAVIFMLWRDGQPFTQRLQQGLLGDATQLLKERGAVQATVLMHDDEAARVPSPSLPVNMLTGYDFCASIR